MRNVVIVDAARTPIGRFRGTLASVRADHLGAALLQALAARNGLEPARVDDVIFGCVTQIGEQSANIARTALLSAGWPEEVPGLTVDRKCGSSEVATHMAHAMIAAGQADIVIAGGAEAMSRVPMGSNRDIHGEPFGHHWLERFELTAQGEGAERICDRWGFTRDTLDDYAISSHRRAAKAADSCRFDREIVPIDVGLWGEPGTAPITLAADETIRRDTSPEKLATLKTSFRPDGRVTAGNASQISDGAAALLLMEEGVATRLSLKPRARIVAATTVGSDPELMLTGPLAATAKVLQKTGLALDDIDLYEVNEAFAPVPLMWLAETGADPARLNVNGGAIALGHPLGGSGARLMTTLLHEMERRGARYGLQSMCCAGGLGTATVVERL
ncbi:MULTISPECIES: thiolase family protein [unclassified Chelatococcus]|uniref:thiolase family protein n=1 Tax=unclassified Chelatococcus TaxID=2638111 RepID=UPI001BCF1B10|nr:MULTISPECIES: thiolase family protein [unclassified Chelatococcus]MBS7700229.1 thiolase family protein [Chelatococcus sp. YT9]MBX3558200.1 thiolase family protein [Chelatococcus sp.]